MTRATEGMWDTRRAVVAAVVALSAALALMLALPSVALAAPTNDNFGSAQTISGASASVTGTNVDATEETGEPEPFDFDNTHSSVWYSWTAPQSGQTATFDTCNSDFDTVLSVHTGSAVDSLTRVARDHNSCTFSDGNNDNGSKVSFNVTAGTTYYVRVASLDAAPTGNFTLKLQQVATPANDSFGSAQTVSGKLASVSGTNIGATEETGEPEPDPTMTFHRDTNSSVWYSWTAPESEQVTINTCTSDFDTVLSVHTGSALSELLEVASDDQGCFGTGPNNSGSRVSFNATAGTTYYIRVASWAFNTWQGNFTLNLRTASGPPLNDNFADAELISGESPSVNGKNIAATTETGEPDTTDVAHSSVWYRWTAPLTGQVAIDTCTSDFDTVVSAYTGSALGSLTQTALDHDSCASADGNDSGSKVSFNATAGTTYRIRVASWSGSLAQGNFTLNVRYVPPPNDNFANFELISGESASISGKNIGATTETGETGTNFPGPKSVWYRWTAPHSGQVAIDTCTATFDTRLNVYTGRALSSLTQVAQDDDSCTFGEGNERGSKLTFATAGATYYIRVASTAFFPQPGSFTLDVNYVAPPNDNFGSLASTQTISGDAPSVNGTNVGATLETGEPQDPTTVVHSSVWYRWTAPETGQVTLDTCASDFDTVLSVHTGSVLSSLTQAALDDQGCTDVGPNNDGSKLTFNATANTLYRIRVASWSGDPEQGNFTLKARYVPPPNDNFGNAELISGDSPSVNGTNVGATTETGETGTSVNNTSSVWYRWTAPFSGPVAVDTCTSNFDTVLSVHTGSTVSGLARLAEDDQSCTIDEGNNSGSKLSFDATKDTTYYIRVASFGTNIFNKGNFTLDLVLTDNAAPDTTITGGPDELINVNTATFSFSGSDNKSDSANLLFSYRLDDGGWSEYSSDTSATLSSLSDGPHTFYVKAKDETNIEDASPAERSFAVETEAPSVLTTSPTPGATNVPRLDPFNPITATFSEPMKQSTISTTTIKMKVGTKSVPVKPELSDDGKTVTIDPFPTDPLKPLAANKKYKVTITTGAQDLSGKALDQNPALSGNQPMVWTFTTGST